MELEAVGEERTCLSCEAGVQAKDLVGQGPPDTAGGLVLPWGAHAGGTAGTRPAAPAPESSFQLWMSSGQYSTSWH